jgi:hypothetical protein
MYMSYLDVQSVSVRVRVWRCSVGGDHGGDPRPEKMTGFMSPPAPPVTFPAGKQAWNFYFPRAIPERRRLELMFTRIPAFILLFAFKIDELFITAL